MSSSGSFSPGNSPTIFQDLAGASLSVVLFSSDDIDISDKASWDKVFGGKIPASVVYVLADTIEENPELAQKYVNALYKSMQWLGQSSEDEIFKVVGPLMPRFAEDLVKREIAYYKKIWQFDASFPAEDFANGAKVWFRAKTKIKPLEYSAVADMSFLEKAQKS